MHSLSELSVDIIPHDVNMPGNWLPLGEGGDLIWVGPDQWASEHGLARVEWLADKPINIMGALLEDGARGYLFKKGHPARNGAWRCAIGKGQWVHGRIEIRRDDVCFFKDDRMKPPPAPKGSIADRISSSEVVKSYAKTEQGAQDLYAALAGNSWSDGVGNRQSFTWAEAASLVAEARGMGEIYSDFFLSGGEGFVTGKCRVTLAKAGLHLRPREFTDREHEAEEILLMCERRPVSMRPHWYESIKPLTSHPLGDRMHLCAHRGQVGYQEWDHFWETVYVDDE